MIRSRDALRIVLDGLRRDAGGPGGAARRCSFPDWEAAIMLANEHLVAPAFYSSLQRTGRVQDLPEEVRDYLAFLHHQNAKRNDCLRRQAAELIAGLNAVGIEPMLLKGGLGLFFDHSPDPASRIIRDLDFLVPLAAADRAFEALRILGYRQITQYPAGHHAYGDFARDGDPGAVDLHFELIDSHYVLPAKEVWQRTEAARRGRLRFFAPSRTDIVLHALLHAQVHYKGNYYLGNIELRQLHDFATLVRRLAGSIEWTWIASRLAQHHISGPQEAYLMAAGRLLGLPWPLATRPGALARLQVERCVLQLRWPLLARTTVPLANLCAALAWHRMNGLYEERSPLVLRRLQHAIRFVRKSGHGALMRRLFRA